MLSAPELAVLAIGTIIERNDGVDGAVGVPKRPAAGATSQVSDHHNDALCPPPICRFTEFTS